MILPARYWPLTWFMLALDVSISASALSILRINSPKRGPTVRSWSLTVLRDLFNSSSRCSVTFRLRLNSCFTRPPLLTSSSITTSSLVSASLSSYSPTNSLRFSTGIGTACFGPTPKLHDQCKCNDYDFESGDPRQDCICRPEWSVVETETEVQVYFSCDS